MSTTPEETTSAGGQKTTASGMVESSSVTFPYSLGRHRTLMDSLLSRKIELAAGANANTDRPLIRTDSLDSTSSLGSISSMPYGDDVCRCDDCLLGIADLYTLGVIETALTKKKVTFGSWWFAN